MIKIELAPEITTALEHLRPEKNDRSGIGVHYVDAYLKPLRAGVTLPDGVKFSAKRRGLKVTLALGLQKGEGLLRRLSVSKDPIVMLRAALDEAGAKIGVKLTAGDGKLWLEITAASPAAQN
ncbi:MAG: hypothetical protein EBT98_07240 [Opitutaceae bacterium]|jgi:hypothetical protein|nr:hypothetical protein [Opitutaceae bacterium]NBR59207.1 hypothetical protein [Opitutaceae bacterium]